MTAIAAQLPTGRQRRNLMRDGHARVLRDLERAGELDHYLELRAAGARCVPAYFAAHIAYCERRGWSTRTWREDLADWYARHGGRRLHEPPVRP